MSKKNVKKHSSLSDDDFERLQLLQKAHEKTGMQLQIEATHGIIAKVDERSALIAKTDNPREKYRIYYLGIRNILMLHLPKGKQYQEGRQLIYDEKNIFLTGGWKKSDNNGIRKRDGRMTTQDNMNEMYELIVKWANESRKPIELYNILYALNEKYDYGHENYDKTTISYNKALSKIKEK